MADAYGSEPYEATRGGSSPLVSTTRPLPGFQAQPSPDAEANQGYIPSMSAGKYGRIEEGTEGIGAPTEEEVVKRAKELAKIEGRAHPDKNDLQNALEELTGEAGQYHGEEDAFTSWASRPDATGGRVNTESFEEESIDHPVGEELMNEGVDEALHDEMLEARRAAREKEE